MELSTLHVQVFILTVLQVFNEYIFCGVQISQISVHTLLSKLGVSEVAVAHIHLASSGKVVASGSTYTASLM